MSRILLPSSISRRAALKAGLGAALATRFSGIAREAAAAPIDPIGTDNNSVAEIAGRYFPETGHNLKGPFLDRWQVSGGKEVLGAPLSEERYVEGVGIVQTFETVS